jgi:ABC-type nitrate/sulfonate/bicarbonate transport system ATPase subunit
VAPTRAADRGHDHRQRHEPGGGAAARAYGYVFQAAGLFPWRTIEGNVRLPLEIMGYSRAEQRERVRRVLELVELEGSRRSFPGSSRAACSSAPRSRARWPSMPTSC